MYLTYRKSNRGKEDVEGGQSAMYTVCTFDRVLVVRLRNDFEGKYFRFPASAGAPYQTMFVCLIQQSSPRLFTMHGRQEILNSRTEP